ncbi:MAG: 2-dehydropantoate 2-reductase [Burkholderiales bacterium]|nr:2-dehydropantoate 2-reductase [Burkholderiales bacterium]
MEKDSLIYVIGAGAMGGFYGGLIKLAGYNVSLIDVREDHVAIINRDGLRVEDARGRHLIKISAYTGHRDLARGDLAFVLTDSNATRDAALIAKEVLKADGFAMTLQNGIGNVEALIEQLGRERVVAGVTMNSGAQPELGLSVYTNADMTTIGELDGAISARILGVADMLNEAGIKTEVVDDPMSYIYSKFVLNCGVNAIAAVTGLRSGEVYRTPELRQLQSHIIDEVLKVVQAKGWKLSERDPRGKILHHSKLRFNKPSMLQHVEQGRRTEIDAINGALVREAHALGMAVPYNEAVVAIVKGVEKSRWQLLHQSPIDYAQLEAEASREEQ